MTSKDVRYLAYECAKKFNKNFPKEWSEPKSAGVDWLYGFLKRHPSLSIRTPEATSLARATSFNKVNVKEFFDKFSDVINKYKFVPSEIYNLDETGITTVQKPCKIISRKGIKQVGAMTSAERGSLVTLELAVSASGNSIPPMFVFPRVNFQDHFIRDGPAGCIGAAHPSGWMTATNFLVFMRHFILHTRPTLAKPVLLLMDNHNSHLSIDVIDLCKQSGVVLMSFPLHCSHKLQPLDRSVYGPLKRFINNSSDSWMKSNPGKTMTIYDIPGIVAQALPAAITPINIQMGFRVSGISPFNRDVFGDDEFLPSAVTDRALADHGYSQPAESLPDVLPENAECESVTGQI